MGKLIVGLYGPRGVGKSTLARKLVLSSPYKSTVISVADPLRKMLRELGVSAKQMKDPVLKQKKIPGLNVSSRYLLQTLGTDWGRNINKNIWLWSLEQRIKNDSKNEMFIIDDIRFINEADWVLNQGGSLAYVRRKGVDYTNEHSSEKRMPKRILDESDVIDL